MKARGSGACTALISLEVSACEVGHTGLHHWQHLRPGCPRVHRRGRALRGLQVKSAEQCWQRCHRPGVRKGSRLTSKGANFLARAEIVALAHSRRSRGVEKTQYSKRPLSRYLLSCPPVPISISPTFPEMVPEIGRTVGNPPLASTFTRASPYCTIVACRVAVHAFKREGKLSTRRCATEEQQPRNFYSFQQPQVSFFSAFILRRRSCQGTAGTSGAPGGCRLPEAASARRRGPRAARVFLFFFATPFVRLQSGCPATLLGAG